MPAPADTAQSRPTARGGSAHEINSATTTLPARSVTGISREADSAAARGWHVFPTRADGKEPRFGLSWPEAATCDLDRLARATWRPGENYGIAAKKSGLVILDLDKPKPDYVFPFRWREWADEPGITDGSDVLATIAERCSVTEWPATFTVRTPSGGMHLYYIAPCDRSIGNRPLGPMIDVRGGGDSDGGYVIGPGSVIGGKRYEITDDEPVQPLPAWVADLLDPPVKPVTAVQCRPQGSVHARMRGLLAVVLDGQPGDRNGRVFWAACRASELVSAGLVERDVAETALISAALASGLRGGEPEARKAIASGMRAAA